MSKPKPPPKEQAESSFLLLRIRRFKQPLVLKRPPAIFVSSNEEVPPKGPTIASLSAKNKTMCEDIRKVNAHLAESLVKIKYFSEDINELHHGLGQKITRVARAARVADVLD